MRQAVIVHTNTGSRPDAFWLTFMTLAMGVSILAGAALAVGPIAFLIAHPGVGMLIPLLLVPAGVWIAVKAGNHARKLRWHYSHLPAFTLFADRIESAEWPNPLGKGVRIPHDGAANRRVIALDTVTSVVASLGIMRQVPTRYGNPFTETAPVLYFRYRAEGRDCLLSVPFPSHTDPGVDLWLRHATASGIPLHYTAAILFRHDTQIMDDSQRLDHLNAARDLVSYRFSNGWMADEGGLRQQWMALQDERRDEEETRDPGLKEKRSRHTARQWIGQLLVFVWLGMVAFLQQFAALEWGWNPANPTVSFAAVLLFGFAFFHSLRRRLRWPYIFIYSGGALVTGFLILTASTGLSVAEQDVAAAFCLATLAFQPFCWVPYLVVKKWTAKRNDLPRRETHSAATNSSHHHS